MRLAAAAILGLAASPGVAFAYPDGAPWGAADPGGAEPCTSCHFDHDAVHDSPALSLAGLPERIEAGQRYILEISFEDEQAAAAGFQVLVRSASEDPGALVAPADDVETVAAAARSSRPRRPADGCVTWELEWQSPPAAAYPVEILVAASAANDDGSAFGDVIHFRRFEAGRASDTSSGED